MIEKTYTFTIPANQSLNVSNSGTQVDIPIITTGIQLGTNEHVTGFTKAAASSFRVKNLTNESFGFNVWIDFLKKDGSSVANFYNNAANITAGATVTIDWPEKYGNVSYYTETNYLLNAKISCCLDRSISNNYNVLQTLDPISFTITTEINNSHTLTTAVYPSNAGTVTSGGSVEVGANTLLTATPGTGYVFDRWVFTKGVFSNPNSSTATYTMPDEDSTVYATFKQSGSALTAGRYDGSEYNAVIPMYYDGTNWIECDLKYYNGSNWVDSDTL